MFSKCQHVFETCLVFDENNHQKSVSVMDAVATWDRGRVISIAARMGKVIRVSRAGIWYYKVGDSIVYHLSWTQILSPAKLKN
jgi:hypothetical protein